MRGVALARKPFPAGWFLAWIFTQACSDKPAKETRVRTAYCLSLRRLLRKTKRRERGKTHIPFYVRSTRKCWVVYIKDIVEPSRMPRLEVKPGKTPKQRRIKRTDADRSAPATKTRNGLGGEPTRPRKRRRVVLSGFPPRHNKRPISGQTFGASSLTCHSKTGPRPHFSMTRLRTT